MKRLTAVLLTLFLLCLAVPVSAASAEPPGAVASATSTAIPTIPSSDTTVVTPGENQIIREYSFVTESEDFHYEVPPQVSENGRLYHRKDVWYELVGQEPIVQVEERTFTHEETLTGLSKQSEDKFPGEIEIDEDGFIGKIPRTSVEWTEQAKDGGTRVYSAEIDLSDQVDVPTPDKEREVVYKDPVSKADVIEKFPLKEVRKTVDYRWLSNHTAMLVLRENDGISLTDNAPAWQGQEARLLSLMRLDPQKYVIRSARWQGGAAVNTADGVAGGAMDSSRTVEFTMDRYAAHFVAVYEGEVKSADTVTFDGVASYEGVLYRDVQTGMEYAVKAIVTYEAAATATPAPTATPEPLPEPSPAPEPEPQSSPIPIAAAVAAPLVVAAAVFVFFWRRKQKEKNGE